MAYIDLHVHSTASDGTCTPAQLVDYALKKGLSAIAVTDHDTVAGLDEAFLAAEGTSLEVVAGIEFSTEYHGKDVHIVGLDIDYRSLAFQNELTRFQNSRDLRNEKMIHLLQQQGFSITWEQMQKEYGDGVWTRAHFGRFLLEHGYVADISEAFRLYLGDGCPCFIPREKVTPGQAVRLICESGGIPILAHPLLYHFQEEELLELIEKLKEDGLLAAEAMYSTYSKEDERYMHHLAKRTGLAVSGGSDFHGSNKPHIDLGSGCDNLAIPYEVLTHLRTLRDREGRL